MILALCSSTFAQTKSTSLSLSVSDDKGTPVADANIDLLIANKTVLALTTDKSGHATSLVPEGAYNLVVSKKGYLRTETVIVLAPGTSSQQVDVVISPIALSEQQVDVQATAESPVTETAPVEKTIQASEAKETPNKPATVTDALPLVPGVVRGNDGSVHIAGMGESHSTLLVNSVDVTDPSTGSFGLTVPIDSVQTIAVSEMPYLAQYGRFTAGVVTAETRRGGEKWDFSLNDPLPEFRIRSGHLEGLKDATPRLNFSGPLIKDRLYIVEGAEYTIIKSQVYTLPYPDNQTKTQSFNSFTQFDYLVSPTQTITASFHIAPHTYDNEGLNHFNPIPLTPDASYHPYTATVTDRLAIGGGVLQSVISGMRVNSSVTRKGTEDMVLTPVGNEGNYYSTQGRRANRIEWVENYTTRSYHLPGGDHTVGAGVTVSRSQDVGHFDARPVNVEDGSGDLLERITYSGSGRSYGLNDTFPSAYVQDHWVISPHFATDYGLRLEGQSITHTVRFAPRAGFVWSPDAKQRTVIRGGAGVFYDSVPLNVYAFRNYPEQTVTSYAPGCDASNITLCTITSGPTTYVNVTQTVSEHNFLFVDRSQHTGNFAPYSLAWHVEFERRINPFIVFRTKYLHSMANNLITLQQEYFQNQNALVLSSNGDSHTRQGEFVAEIGKSEKRRFYFSYVRQHAHGMLTDTNSYLSDFPFPVVRSNIKASLPNEVPNRFLLWGLYSLPWRMRVLPKIEYRNGFPWQPTTVSQDYVTGLTGPQTRFPKYFDVDVRVSKDFTVMKKHSIRLSGTVNNLTNHMNYLEVHSNIADPQYGTFFGNYSRKFTVDFDWLF
ncbi:MAG TPA: carboxypeptidase regulatory-like domain-containing protein [Candidatus Acidoferrales bacterium]|nr:carboxypeptidase regulatory-like domain-containing protein [Candidatus Acidoferrales bacterium]